MYTRAQKESSSVSPTSTHKKSNNSESSHSFSVQRQQDLNSSQEKEIPSYSRNAADSLAANVMRSMEEGKDSDEMSLEAGVQTKLTVGAVGDKYEQEADRVAAQVMSMSVAPDHSPQVQRFGEEDNPVQRWSLAQSITPVVQRQVDEQVQMRSLVQRAFQGGGNEASGDIESRLNASKGGGSALAPEVRTFMEPRFGADFSSVRVHTGGEAVQMNQELGAQAFTHGSDVYFGQGKSPGNNELTAHELTHVVQQNAVIQRQENFEHRELQKQQLVQHQSESQGVPSYLQLIANSGKGEVSQYQQELRVFRQENDNKTLERYQSRMGELDRPVEIIHKSPLEQVRCMGRESRRELPSPESLPGNDEMVKEVLNFFYPDFSLPEQLNQQLRDLSAVMLWEAIRGSEMMDYVPRPSGSRPGFSWLVKEAVKIAWRRGQSQGIYVAVRNQVARAHRSEFDLARQGI
jgi:hypothetical protein